MKLLAYKIQRLFGERGKVISVKPVNRGSDYLLDSYGNHPQEITFENPLGEVMTRNSPDSKPFYVICGGA